MTDEVQLSFGLDVSQEAANQSKRSEALARAFGFMSLANQAFGFAETVKRENPRHSKHMKENPQTGEITSYDPTVLEEKADKLDQLAIEAMRDACFYCLTWQKQACFINHIEPFDRYRLGFEVRFRGGGDRKEFLKQLKVDPAAICFPNHLNTT